MEASESQGSLEDSKANGNLRTCNCSQLVLNIAEPSNCKNTHCEYNVCVLVCERVSTPWNHRGVV